MRVLIGVHHPLMRYGLVQLIKDVRQVEYIVTAETGEEVLRALRKYPFDFLFVHEKLPGAMNFSSVFRTGEERMKTVLITSEEESWIEGADSVIEETMELDDWLRVLAKIMQGEQVRRLEAGSGVGTVSQLSIREIEIFQLKLEGYSVRDSARFLSIKPKTVENHRRNIAKKMELKSNQQWIQKGKELGFI